MQSFCCRAMLLILLMLVAPLTVANKTKSLHVMKQQMCSDLCTSGLGGAPCGELCNEDMGFDLRSRLRQFTLATARKKDIYGPRLAVCPVLCHNNLGDPLCGCHVERYVRELPRTLCQDLRQSSWWQHTQILSLHILNC